MPTDLSRNMQIEILADASAVNGIASRAGLGSKRHIEIHYPWVQERVINGDILLRHANSQDNPARLLARRLDMQKQGEAHEVHWPAISSRQVGGHTCPTQRRD